MSELSIPSAVLRLNTEQPVSDELLEQTLAPYLPACRYLSRAWLKTASQPDSDAVTARGEFAIPESCYIADTGHFNAVEFNICYNQLAYTLVAGSIARGLLSAFRDWTLRDYQHRQLPDFLIVSFKSEFRAPIRAASFVGSVAIEKVEPRRRATFITTRCSFNDDQNGLAHGEVLTAVLHRQADPKTTEQAGR